MQTTTNANPAESIESIESAETAATDLPEVKEDAVPANEAETTPESPDEAVENIKEVDADESVKEDEADAVSEDSSPRTEATICGVDVSEVGTEYPASKHRIVTSFRKEIKKLEAYLFTVNDDSIEEIAKNLQAGINRLDVRSRNRKKHMKTAK